MECPFQALADPTRREILRMVRDAPLAKVESLLAELRDLRNDTQRKASP
jgi:DNA-binding transcriptional ArsR family regulator